MEKTMENIMTEKICNFALDLWSLDEELEVQAEKICKELLSFPQDKKYSYYCVCLSFAGPSIRNGEILLKEMLKQKILSDTQLQDEKTKFIIDIPMWAREIVKNYPYNK